MSRPAARSGSPSWLPRPTAVTDAYSHGPGGRAGGRRGRGSPRPASPHRRRVTGPDHLGGDLDGQRRACHRRGDPPTAHPVGDRARPVGPGNPGGPAHPRRPRPRQRGTPPSRTMSSRSTAGLTRLRVGCSSASPPAPARLAPGRGASRIWRRRSRPGMPPGAWLAGSRAAGSSAACARPSVTPRAISAGCARPPMTGHAHGHRVQRRRFQDGPLGCGHGSRLLTC